ncbi:MAG: hypothetical protein AB7G12_10100 [Thermoanaerobaculia bacterium]
MRTLRLVPSAIGSARRNWRLALALWFVQLVLAVPAALPIAGFLQAELSRFPEGDLFLQRFSLVLMTNVLFMDGAALLVLRPVIGALALLALLANAFCAGGALEVLLFPDHRSLAMRFGRGGGRHFGRFVRMGAAAIATALLLGGLLSAPFWIARGALDFRAEGAKFCLAFAGSLAFLFGLLLSWLALDLARIRIARTSGRRAVRTYFRTLGQVLRRPLRPLVLWLGLALPFGLAGALLYAARIGFTADGALLVLLALSLVELGVLVRAFYRIALWSGEITLEAAGAARGSRIV